MYKDDWPIFERALGQFRYNKIKKYIKSQNGNMLVCVDIGCGFNGRFLHSISGRLKYGYGFDIRANEHTDGNIEIINNSRYGGNLPLDDGTTDVVFMLAVIEHLDVDNDIVAEGIRILKPGGRIVITTPTPAAKPVLEFLSYKCHLISEASIREHKHYYTEAELREILENNNCVCERYSKFQMGFNEIIVGVKKGKDREIIKDGHIA